VKAVSPLEWKNDELVLVDQRKLPLTESFVTCKTVEDTFEAIKVMVVRGAPLIGFSALYGMALAAKELETFDLTKFKKSGDFLKSARPTAVNLAYEVDRAIELASSLDKEGRQGEIYNSLVSFSHAQIEKIFKDNTNMAKLAMKDLEEKYGDRPLRLMTLCNTGFLACGPMGTALGVIDYMNQNGRVEKVFASETRPYLQGGRLTAYELSVLGIPHYVTVEGAFSYLMREKLVDAIFIGADRIVANGDTANKVGSSTLAIVAKYYGVPFYTVAPTSTFDLSLKTGDEIEIEIRPEEEVLFAMGQRICPEQSRALNPSFDVTSHRDLTGIICENGLIKDITPENVERTVKGL